MVDVFVDTSGWGQLMDNSQLYHIAATNLFQSVQQRGYKLVTTNYVITELVALLTSPMRLSRPRIIALVGELRAWPDIEVIHIDTQLDEEAWQLLAKRQDKDWSLVDCVSFTVMQQRGISEALTSDHHFEQAGFIQLLKP